MCFHPSFRVDGRGFWAAQDRTGRALYIVLGFALLAAFALVLSFWIIPSPAEYFTEFYLLGPEGLAEGYPRQARVGEPLQVKMGVVNRERTSQTYRLEIWVQDPGDPSRRQQVAALDPFDLTPGMVLARPVAWSMPWAGPDQQVEFLLFRQGDTDPYRRLRLILDVEPPG